jgi:hypothetical protein
MTDGKITNGREYFREYFNFGCILCGKVRYLEEIKGYIVDEYVKKGLVKLIKPTYSKRMLSIVDEEEWQAFRKGELHISEKENVNDGETFDFACVLRGEVKYLEALRKYNRGGKDFVLKGQNIHCWSEKE